MKPTLIQVLTVCMNSKAEYCLCQFKFWLCLNNLDSLKSNPLSTQQKLQQVAIPALSYLNNGIKARLRSESLLLQTFLREITRKRPV